MRLVNWRTLIAGAASIALAACGDDVTVVQPPPTVTLNPTSIACVTGQQTALGVSVSGGTSGATPTVTFQSSGSGATVTQSGTGATITCGATPGSAVITVTVTQGGQTVTSSVPVTVSQAPSQITSVSVSPNTATIAVGGTITLTPTVTANVTGANTAVTFTSVQPTIATVDANGVVKGVAPGIATIRVASVASPNIVAVATITVAATSQFVQSLTVQPSAITLQTGATQTLASTVTLAPGAPAGTSTGATFTSSDTTVARVSSTGVVTAVRNGTAVITVASQAAPTVTQAVSVTVRDPAPVRLTIQGVRVIGAAGTLVPADLNNVGGNLFVTLNLDPGDFRPDSVRLRLGTATVNCQRFSDALAAAYKAALTTGAADVQQIECQLNTSQFNSTTGVAAVLNGQQPLTAEVFFRPNSASPTSSTQTASIPLQLTVANQSGFFVNVTNTPTAAQAAVNPQGQATGPQGVLWRAGSVQVTVLPVNFVNVVNPGTQSFTITLQDNTGVIATQTASQNASAATFTATFPGATAASRAGAPANSLNGYTSPNAGVAPAFNPGGAYVGGGTLVVVGTQAGTSNTAILNAAGQPAGLPAPAGGFTNALASPIFIDNQSPEPRPQFVSSNFTIAGGTQGFINGAFVFADSVQQAAANTGLGDNNGVDRVSRQFFVAPSSVVSGLTANDFPGAIISGGTATVNGSTLNQNISSTAFVAAARLTDALGNSTGVFVGSNSAAGSLFTFGVITATPTLSINNGSIGNNGAVNTASGVSSITFTANSTAGASFPTNYIVGTLQVQTPSGSVFCATQADVSNAGVLQGAAQGIAGGQSTPCPQIAFNQITIDPATAQEGIYTFSGQVRDLAGNLSTVSTRTFVVDRTAPTVLNAAVLSPPLTGGQAETFTATASDNFALISQNALVGYPTATPIVLRYDGGSLGTAFAAPFTKNANLSVTVPTFVRAIALQTDNTNATNNGFTTVGTVAVGASDMAANWAYSSIQSNVIQGQLDQTQTAIPTFFGAANGPSSARLTFQASTAGSATTGGEPGALASATGGTPTSFTINLQQVGTANTPFANQFTKVELFIRGTAPGLGAGATASGYPFTGITNNVYRKIADFSGSSISISTGSSTITNSFTVTPGVSGIPAFPSSGARTADLLVLATDANGYSVAFIVPQFTINP